ncbi:hypothetical protein ITJ44_07025 [Clavibacter sp. VKM Ac-2873]|uniref:hypothetical protein n=1 Tax=Clavibacter sp. VKM Ac-2873 TaxID=2783813 RepID=UPI00188DA777|nr:hypothetical protein [Clavibacter sp. VKM Ac-2873]MBF4617826.1 hypothetical protein [Clavibacter sp. VKM Ac-2873]
MNIVAFIIAFALFLGGMALFAFAFYIDGFELLAFFAGILCVAASIAIPAHVLKRTDA